MKSSQRASSASVQARRPLTSTSTFPSTTKQQKPSQKEPLKQSALSTVRPKTSFALPRSLSPVPSAPSHASSDANYRAAVQAIKDASFLLITAGAGMSADSGLATYKDIADVPAYRDMKLDYADLCDPVWISRDPSIFFGFWGSCMRDYRATEPHEGYRLLRQLAESKDPSKLFVYTSNVDCAFARAGFDRKRIFEIHGNIETWQCSKPCCEEVFRAPSERGVHVDTSTMRAPRLVSADLLAAEKENSLDANSQNADGSSHSCSRLPFVVPFASETHKSSSFRMSFASPFATMLVDPHHQTAIDPESTVSEVRVSLELRSASFRIEMLDLPLSYSAQGSCYLDLSLAERKIAVPNTGLSLDVSITIRVASKETVVRIVDGKISIPSSTPFARVDVSMHPLVLRLSRSDRVGMWVVDRLGVRIPNKPESRVQPRSDYLTNFIYCPKCGALARPNILMFDDDQWIEPTDRRYKKWRKTMLHALLTQAREKLVILEFGCGKRVPTVRMHNEQLLRKLGVKATLIRINMDPRDSTADALGVSNKQVFTFAESSRAWVTRVVRTLQPSSAPSHIE
jgi:NAD-dependent SIR2 family protein deacetylase